MAVSRAERRALREPAVRALFGDRAAAALDLLELTEIAWHDAYREITPPDRVVDDLLVVSDGDLEVLVKACRVAVQDSRDLHVWAESLRASGLG